MSVDNIGYVGQGYPGRRYSHAKCLSLSRGGPPNQVVLSGDICQKTHLSSYGGKGYAHVIRRFLPLLRSSGMAEEQIHQMTVLNPTRMLDIAD